MMHRTQSLPALLALTVLTTLVTPAHAQRRPQRSASQQTAAPEVDPATYAQLKYRYIGPVGNRTIAVAGIAGRPYVYYVGAASGGLWRTTDGGVRWEPLFDDQPAGSVSAIAIAPSDPSVIWVGTGEAFIRSHISIGNGVYRSVDGGKTWTHQGLDQTGRIARVMVDPHNPDVVLACALGHAYGPQPERGVFRTTDGGKTWDRVLFVDENTGCSDLVMDPNNPAVVFAGMWQIEIHTWGRVSGGSGSGIFMSRDGGVTWKRLAGHGLPTTPVGRIGLAIAPTNSEHLYALIETGDGVAWQGKPAGNGELWTSQDGGENWRLTSYDRELAGRTAYYSRVFVSPDNENEAYFLSAAFSKTLDGGEHTIDVSYDEAPGGDNHDMWIDPTNGDRMIVAHDGGIGISVNRGRTWRHIQLPIAQVYHVEADNQIPYYVYTNRQDGPSYRGPSNSRGGGFGGAGSIGRGEWHSVGGGESGWATPDPVDPNIIWSSASGYGSVGGVVVRYDERARQYRNVEVWPLYTVGWPAAELPYRFVWTFPLTISPFDHNTIYVGSQYVHVTTDGGSSWKVISPDLTLDDKSRQQISGGLTPDDIGVEYAGVVFAIAESPLKRGLIWAGTNDGLIHVTTDGGAHWTNVTANLPSLPPWGTVSNIEPSHFDTATAYLTVDLHQVNNRDPFVYRTTDYGRTWKLIVNGVPKSPFSYAHVVREDPFRKGLLYLGTENGLYVSFDDGDAWQPLQTNLPHVPVYWITLERRFHDMVVATYGRGVWILDDVTPLERLTPEVRQAAAYLFPPRPAYRFRPVETPAAASDDPTAGRNPAYGAAINYWLKAAAEGDVEVTITDSSGSVVRTLKGKKDAGLNRVVWNLEDEDSKEARLRVPPEGGDWIEIPDSGLAAPWTRKLSVLMPPGRYSAKLRVGGQDYTQPVMVIKDPHSVGSEADIAQQVAMLEQIKADVDTVADMINSIQWVRKQLGDLRRVPGASAAADVLPGADSLAVMLVAVEGPTHQLKLTGRGQDDCRYPAELLERLLYLADGVSEGDYAPTTQARDVLQYLEQRMHTIRARYDGVMTQDVAGFNALLRRSGVPNVIAR
jgi:photosystem II stability/assembly factor-like uncharacterized protein